VGICDRDYFNFRYLLPVDTTVIPAGDGIIGRDEYQTVGLFDIERKLAGSVTGQFMAARRREV